MCMTPCLSEQSCALLCKAIEEWNEDLFLWFDEHLENRINVPDTGLLIHYCLKKHFWLAKQERVFSHCLSTVCLHPREKS